MPLSVGRYQSFVVRILSRHGEVVQGQITHVASRESIRFRDAQRMLDFMLDHLKGLPEDPPDSPEGGGQE